MRSQPLPGSWASRWRPYSDGRSLIVDSLLAASERDESAGRDRGHRASAASGRDT
ncbi:hypothetical protein [Halococcoides cellulosivorans]|uniref:hypothetical protein n=1 Tax=Halococcoides cellulosivorans TaxID=1679096 RepID=UPI00131F4670|nr:hypothetical protein [Halococcoides cellulosivorans]